MVYAVLIYFAAQLIAGIVVFIYAQVRGFSEQQASDWLGNSVLAQFWYVLLAEALTFGAIWRFVRWRKGSLRMIGWRQPRWWNVVQAFSGFAVYLVVYALVLTVAMRLFTSLNVDQKQELGFDSATGGSSLVLTFLSLVVLPPIVEETVFRGFVFTGLRGKLRPLWAAVLTSLLFAVAHLEFGSGKPLLWVAALDTFTLSMVLCYLRQKSDSLWPGIMLHALKNGVAFVSLYILHVH